MWYDIGRGNDNQSIRAGKKTINTHKIKKLLLFCQRENGKLSLWLYTMVKVGQISRGRSSHRAGIDILWQTKADMCASILRSEMIIIIFI